LDRQATSNIKLQPQLQYLQQVLVRFQ
jgi:hypothetical protein